MTSARSSLPNEKKRAWDPQVQMTKHRLWVVAFTALCAFLYYVVGSMLYLSRQKQVIETAMTDTMYQTYFHGTIQDYVRHFYGFCNMSFLLVVIVAVIIGLEGFSYLHKMQTMDFYECQPIKRSSRFARMYLNGLCIFLKVWGLATLLGVGIGAIFGGMNGAVALEMLLEFVRLCILFFGVYNIAIFAAAISKNVLVSVLMTGILLASEAVYRVLVTLLETAYFTTYYDQSLLSSNAQAKSWITSPIANYLNGRTVLADLQRSGVVDMSMIGNCLKSVWHMEVLSVIIGVVFFIIAYFAFARRKSEAVGQGLVYRWMEGVTKIIISIPLGAATGMIMDTFFDELFQRPSWITIALIILVIVIFCVIAEIICRGNIKAFTEKAWQIPIALALSFAFFFIFRADVLGYDRYVPKENQIQDVVFFDNNNYTAFYEGEPPADNIDLWDRSALYTERDDYLEHCMHLTDVDAAIQLAHLGMEKQRENVRQENNILGYPAVMMFHMKDGSVVARYLLLPLDVDEELMNRLVGTEEYHNAVYQMDFLQTVCQNEPKLMTVQYTYGYGSSELPKDPEITGGLIDAYIKDLRGLNFSKLKNKRAIGTVYFIGEESLNYVGVEYPVYEDFLNTITYLEEQGVYHSPEIPVETVVQMNIYGCLEDGKKEYNADCYYEDPELMAQVLPNLKLDISHDWDYYPNEIYVTISLNGAAEDGVYYEGTSTSYNIDADKLPAQVVEDFKNAPQY
ncbi:MAG: ABC transporter permease [Lachnospiraceae bacterium]|nr:ABC transporter permease [Lachnospiraceae bacterium]